MTLKNRLFLLTSMCRFFINASYYRAYNGYVYYVNVANEKFHNKICKRFNFGVNLRLIKCNNVISYLYGSLPRHLYL